MSSFADESPYGSCQNAALRKRIAGQPVEAARHRAFVVARRIIGACILVLAPLFLLVRGAPTVSESAVILLAQIPLICILFGAAWVKKARKGQTPILAGESDILLQDIDAAVQTQIDLAAARATAERETSSNIRLLANVSHELRTPLNAIIGFSQMLAAHETAPSASAKQREYASIIGDCGHHLLEIVNSMLDLSKIESGAMQISCEPFVLQALADGCCDMMQLNADESGVTLAREYVGALSEIVADKRACKQILINLLSNAVKFTPRGGTVKLLLQSEGTQIRITVADEGIGIAASDLARLGDPFFQARAPHDGGRQGTGLGLSIVRGLVGLHGGSITIESGPWAGTAVSVRLPQNCLDLSTGAPARIETIERLAAAPSTPAVFNARAAMVKKIA